MQDRFTAVWAAAADAEAAMLAERREERHYRRLLALTDGILGRLERRNLAGERTLDDGLRRDIAMTVLELPPRARRRMARVDTVQQALDGIFEVQEELLLPLQRMLHWDRLLTSGNEAAVDEALAHRIA